MKGQNCKNFLKLYTELLIGVIHNLCIISKLFDAVMCDGGIINCVNQAGL